MLENSVMKYVCKVDPFYSSCDECIHCNDSEEICKLRGCVHAVEVKECFERKHTEEDEGFILCSKRNPKTVEDVYLVQTDTGYITQCRWINNGKMHVERGVLYVTEGLEWSWNPIDIPQGQEVVAWMRLPKRVKEE